MANENTDKLSRGTGRGLEEWMDYLRTHGTDNLNDLTHKDMARLAEDGGASPWWAQAVAVEVERAIGRRQVGETTAGTVNASASKTVAGEWREVFSRWLAFVEEKGSGTFPAVPESDPVTSETAKWRYWRVSFVDGSRASMTVSEGSSGGAASTRLAIGHDRLGSLEDRDAIKAHWKGLFADFAETLK